MSDTIQYDKTREEIKLKREKLRQKQAFEAKSKEFDAKLAELENTILDLIEEDEEGNADLIEMLEIFLDAAMETKKIIKVLKNIAVAVECIGSAIGFLDEIVGFMDSSMDMSLQQEYTTMNRFKRWWTQRKAMRNNRNRIKATLSSLLGQLKMAQALSGSMGKLAKDLRKSWKRPAAKKKTKRSSGAPAEMTPAQKRIAELRAQRRGEEAPAGTTPTDDSTNNGSSGPWRPEDIDDITR